MKVKTDKKARKQADFQVVNSDSHDGQGDASKKKRAFSGDGKPYRNVSDSRALRGRPCKLDETLIRDICGFVACGGSLRAFCEQPNTPHIGTVIEWLARGETDGGIFRVFQEQYARAQNAACAAIAGDILAIADKATDSDSASAARVQIDARKWWLSKVKPSVYGDNVGLQIGGNGGITISLERHTTSSAPAISHNVRSAMTDDDAS